MFNPANAITNIESAGKCKEHSFLNSTVLISPVPYLSRRQTGRKSSVINVFCEVKLEREGLYTLPFELISDPQLDFE